MKTLLILFYFLYIKPLVREKQAIWVLGNLIDIPFFPAVDNDLEYPRAAESLQESLDSLHSDSVQTAHKWPIHVL